MLVRMSQIADLGTWKCEMFVNILLSWEVEPVLCQ